MRSKSRYMPPIQDDELVTLIFMIAVLKLIYVMKRNMVPRIRKLDKDHYNTLSDNSGVVSEFKHTENRGQSPKSVRKSLNRLRDIVTTNTTDVERCAFMTLTSRDNMTDPERLMKDWGNFLKKARRLWGKFEYIVVKEPQERGAWHLHVILIFDGKAPYIDNEVLSKKWGKGYVSIKKLEKGSDIGRYFAKAKRMELYPNGMRIFNCSSGVKRPIRCTMTKAEADDIVRDKKELSHYSAVLHDNEGREINEVSVKTYECESKGDDFT